ncbi:hypothetical protein MKW92_003677 [Papaver armeniacum]|nr:hypothetical protein MKW92_003677 [Papaver armeniacum]
METLFSFNSSSHPLLLQSSKNRAFYPFIPSSSSTKKPEFVSFYQKRDYNNVDVFHSISLQLKSAIGSGSCKASASDQSSQPENTAGSTKIPSQELQSKTVRVEFQLIRECLFGQEFLVVGDDPILGVWNPLEAIPLKWSEGHIWRAEVDVPINKTIQFMLILKDQTGEFVWQPGPHRVFQTRAQTNKMVVVETWDFEGLQRSSEEEPLEDVTGNPNTDDTMHA